jgi:hypothetical protein
MKRVLAVSLTALALAGCESHPLSPYVSPRVTGRVLAADTGQPLDGVKITTGQRPDSARSTEPPKGGQILASQPPVQTDRDGRFVLESERVLTPFGVSGWFTLQLVFERSGYERFFTNFSRINLRTNTWQGEPVLDAGNVLLQPARK